MIETILLILSFCTMVWVLSTMFAMRNTWNEKINELQTLIDRYEEDYYEVMMDDN